MRKKSNKNKPVPKFKNDTEEKKFWSNEDSTRYFDWDKALVNPELPKLKYSTESISIRMPASILDRIKAMANERDVPYQSFIKMILADKVEEEMRKYNTGRN